MSDEINTDPLGDEGVDEHESETRESPDLSANAEPDAAEGSAEGEESPEQDDPWLSMSEEERRAEYERVSTVQSNNYKAMTQERHLRKQEREARIQAETRAQQLIDMVTNAVGRGESPEDDEGPSREEDPLGWLEARVTKSFDEKLTAQEQRQQEQRQQQEQAEARARYEKALAQADGQAQQSFADLEQDGAPMQDAIKAVAQDEYTKAFEVLQRQNPDATPEQIHQAAASHVDKVRTGWLHQYAGNYDELGIEILARAAALGAISIDEESGAPVAQGSAPALQTPKMQQAKARVQGARAPAGRPSSPRKSQAYDIKEALALPEDEYERWMENFMKENGLSMSEAIEVTSKQMAVSSP